MERSVQDRFKSLTLLHLWFSHRPALQYDWHARWGGPWDPSATPVYAAWPMLQQILMDHASHSWAALAGWSYVPDTADKTITAFNNGAGKLRRRPPWEKPDPLTSDGREHARAAKPADMPLRRKLRARLGLDDRITDRGA